MNSLTVKSLTVKSLTLLTALALLLGSVASVAGPEEPPAPRPRPVRVPDFREVYRETPVTRAVDRGIGYLRRTQLEDGSWLSPSYGKNTGIVSLAVLSLLARGHEPGRGEHGQVIERAVAWLLDVQRDGLLHRDAQDSHGALYSHGIATLLLGELAGMLDERLPPFESFSRVHRSAVNTILRAQNVPKASPVHVGGWRYTVTARYSDISVSGWQLLALRSAQESGLQVTLRSIEQAVGFIRRCALPDGGFDYFPGHQESTLGRTGTGVLALEICGEHNSPEALRGGDWMLKHPLAWNDPFFYYSAYYGAQAMYQLGGRYWERWQPLSEKVLLEEQDADGKWRLPPNAPFEAKAGHVYTTALAILSLSVEFRYLPIYQR
ncbi:MAG: terpene cyclase/mutase family protein [Planctomycetota bacterium]|nr:terpene cyclase/mutase family protein [Planctomycetota bacterium]